VSRPLTIVLLILAVLVPTGTVDAVRAEQASDVLADVLRMLDEGVASSVIVDWLLRTERPVRALAPDDLIALSKAGASDELVEALLARASGPAAARPASPPPSPSADPPDAPQDGLAGVAITLHYRSQVDSGTERDMRWALFAYLDGEPLIWSRSGPDSAQRSRRIAPGRHVVYVMRESHLDWKRGWRHESYVNLTPIEFTLEAGEGWHLSIDWVVKTFRFSDKGPLSWSLTRWNAHVAGATKTGEMLAHWPRLCEDVEANAPPGKKQPAWIRRDLQGCVRWSALWEGLPGAPDRATVRTALEAVDFRPTP
jgi:hypothetical protein